MGSVGRGGGGGSGWGGQGRKGMTRGADASDVWRDQTCCNLRNLEFLDHQKIALFSLFTKSEEMCELLMFVKKSRGENRKKTR